MVITIEEIRKAVLDSKQAEEIYKKIFYDGNKPKLRMWLVKKGVNFNELDVVESNMNLVFMLNLNKYQHDKIPFERYIWTCFNQELLNYFQSKKLKKNNNIGFGDLGVKSDDGDGVDYEVNLGFIEADTTFELESDMETLLHTLPQLQATIVRMLYYTGWEKDDVCEYLQISREKFNKEIKSAKTAFYNYFLKNKEF